MNNFRTMIRKENGEALWVSINAHVSESAAPGDKPAVEGLIRDINELYINELAVKRLGKFREVIIDNTGLLICVADANLKITLWNKAAERVTGYGFNEIRDSRDPWSLIFPRKDVGLSLIKKADSHDGNAAISERVAVRAKDGILRTLDLSVKKVKIPDLDDYYIIMGNDLTELLTLENELIKNQKLESLGLLAGGIAHDFNNILTAVTGNLSLGVLMDDHKKTISYIAEALDAVNRAKSLTRQLLTFSTGGAPVKETASVAELLRESCEFLFRGSKIKPVYKIHHDFSTADIDTGQINQVFNNVIINAIQAMDGEGNIEIECRSERFGKTNDIGLPPGQYVMVTVKDDGPGIPPSLADNIFDPFFTTKQAGTGLGLPTSFSIIKRHGGTITFNNAPRGGAVFSIFIPASEEIRSHKNSQDSPGKNSRDHSGKILIVDDEPSITDILTDMLDHMGYETFSASGSAEAIRLFEEGLGHGSPFDTVIMDLVLPGEAGGEVTAQKMKALRPDTLFIASSGYANNAVMASYAEYGFDGILPKPFTLADLEKCLSELRDAGT